MQEFEKSQTEYLDTISLPTDLAGSFSQIGPAETVPKTVNFGTKREPKSFERKEITCKGTLNDECNKEFEEAFAKCPFCGTHTHSHGVVPIRLKHTPFGMDSVVIQVNRLRRLCPKCGRTFMQEVPFQAPGHRITKAALRDLLLRLTRCHILKEVAIMTGIDRKTIKEVHKEYLKNKYFDENGKLKAPTCYSRHLGIDEWLLHAGRVYATFIIDLDTGHILWIQDSKKKEVVKEFMDHVGDEWMKHVEAVACDMNADFASAFKERYPHIDIVYDRFHIVKNFNEKVIDPVRKEEYKRLILEGREEDAKNLNKAKYILASNRDTLEQKDKQVIEAKTSINNNDSSQSLFKSLRNPTKARTDYLKRYEELIYDNQNFIFIDIIKEAIKQAYNVKTEDMMKMILDNVIGFCEDMNNKHFSWFGKLIKNHLSGIITFVKHHITSGKCEGCVNLVKTIRRASYGFRDTNYFFLLLLDASRNFPWLGIEQEKKAAKSKAKV